MSLYKRYIPTLQISNRRLVKSVNFIPKRYLGDPLNAIRVFNLKEVSELVVMDIQATQTKKIDFDYLSKLTSQAFLPLTYGGGISSFNDVNKLFQIGFDKVLFGTAAIENAALIENTAKYYGTQSIICSLDIQKGFFGYKITCQGNRKRLYHKSLDETIQNFMSYGAGEILLHDVDRDGTYKGLNHDLIREVVKKSAVPIVACGGVHSIADMDMAISLGASAVIAGSLFSFYGKHKAVLINYGVSD